MENVALILSITALVFTIFSFWWMNWRKGRLRVSLVKHFAIHNSENKLYIELPLVFFNTGAMPVIVESLRLFFVDKNGSNKKLHFNAIRKELGEKNGRYFATPFSINKGESKKIVCEFQKNPSEVILTDANYTLLLEAKQYKSSKWKRVKTFSITIPKDKLDIIKSKYEILEELN
jgi:hypothetical protein